MAQPGWTARLSGCLSALLFALACGPVSDETLSGDAPQAHVLLSPCAGVADEIDQLDVLDLEPGRTHLAWREIRRAPASGGQSALVTRHTVVRLPGRGGAASSDPVPREIEALGGMAPRLVLAAGEVHAIGGPGLARATWKGGRWREEGSLLAPGVRAEAFDVTGGEDGLLAAFLGGSRDGAPDQGLYVVSWPAEPAAPPRLLLDFGPSVFRPPAPALLQEGRTVHVLCGFNAEDRRAGGRAGVKGRLVYAFSEDSGRTWSPPVDLDLDRPATRVNHVGLVRESGRLFAVVRTTDILAIEVRAGLPSSAANRVLLPSRAPALVARAPAFALAGVGPGAFLAWIDGRFRGSDRRWWKPLGGWPWSDSPDWANDDILCAPPGSLLSSVRGSPIQPARVTHPGGCVQALRALSSAGGALVVWAGRERAGRTLDASAPSQIFVTFVPFRDAPTSLPPG